MPIPSPQLTLTTQNNKMLLHQLQAWFRRKSRRGDIEQKPSLPTYDSLGPIPRVLTPLAQRDPTLAAGYYASLSARAITARAIAEGPDAARAMDKALRRIHNTVPKIMQAYGVENDHRLVAYIWAAAISTSADTAREIAQSTKPSYAIDMARRTEANMANGFADEGALWCADFVEAGSGVRARHWAATEPKTYPKNGDRKDGVAG